MTYPSRYCRPNPHITNEVSSKLGYQSFHIFDIFNCNRFCFDSLTRKHGLLFSAKKYWVIRFFKTFLLKYRYFVKLL